MCSWSRRVLVIVRLPEKGGGIVCNVYGLSYHVAGTTTATSVEANGGFLKV